MHDRATHDTCRHDDGGPWRRTIGTTAALTAGAAIVGAAQLGTGTYTPPLSDLEPLGLRSWLLPALWLAATVAVPCAVTAVLARRRSPRTGAAAMTAGGLLLLELAVQVPYVGLDPLQGVMAVVALALLGLGTDAHRAEVARAAAAAWWTGAHDDPPGRAGRDQVW